MPDINWEEFSELKHHTQQERTIICGILLTLKSKQELDKDKFIMRLEILDKRLESFEHHLISLILKYEVEENEEVNNE